MRRQKIGSSKALRAAIVAAVSIAAFGAAAQEDKQPQAPVDDVFADPDAPGEPEPAPAPQDDVQALTPAPADAAPADVPGPASELDGLESAPQPEAPVAAAPATGVRRGETVTLRALDKITARYVDLTIRIGEKKRYASLEILPRSCDKRPPVEFPETTAFVEIFDRDSARSRTTSTAEARPVDTRGKSGKKSEAPPADLPAAAREPHEKVAKGAPADPARIFSGWMFASSPGLSALDHPVYDVWVIDCKTAASSK